MLREIGISAAHASLRRSIGRMNASQDTQRMASGMLVVAGSVSNGIARSRNIAML